MEVLNDHQARLLRNMIRLFDQFRQGILQYYDLVGDLEGALDAGEFRDREFLQKWYDFWTPLESIRAQHGNAFGVEEIDAYISGMEAYLQRVLEER